MSFMTLACIGTVLYTPAQTTNISPKITFLGYFVWVPVTQTPPRPVFAKLGGQIEEGQLERPGDFRVSRTPAGHPVPKVPNQFSL